MKEYNKIIKNLDKKKINYLSNNDFNIIFSTQRRTKFNTLHWNTFEKICTTLNSDTGCFMIYGRIGIEYETLPNNPVAMRYDMFNVCIIINIEEIINR